MVRFRADAPRQGLAYLFWGLSLVGIAGLHRVYLRRPVTGIIYLATFGLLGVGTLLDALRMGELVRQSRIDILVDHILAHRPQEIPSPQVPRHSARKARTSRR